MWCKFVDLTFHKNGKTQSHFSQISLAHFLPLVLIISVCPGYCGDTANYQHVITNWSRSTSAGRVKGEDVNHYAHLVQKRLICGWHPPQAESSWSAVISFDVRRDGQVSNVELLDSSKSSEIDKAALDSVKGASPFPKFPTNFPESLSLRFAYCFRDPKSVMDNYGGTPVVGIQRSLSSLDEILPPESVSNEKATFISPNRSSSSLGCGIGNIAPYRQKLLLALGKNIRPDLGALPAVQIDIDKSGHLIGSKITTPSSDPSNDEKALQAVKMTEYAPLPNWFTADHLSFVINLSRELKLQGKTVEK